MTTKNIQLLRVTHLRGPNIWTYRPVIEAWVDIGAFEDYPSNTLPGFYERLTAMLPGLALHRCGVGAPGGFLERLREGTWVAHILEHVVLELQNLAGMRTGFGKTRQTSVRGVYKMAFRTRQEQVGRAALEAGRELVMAAIEDQPYDMAAAVGRLHDMVDSLCLGPSTAHIVEAATARGIPHLRLTDGNLVQLGHGAFQRRIWTAETDQTSAIAEEIASDKDLTKSLLQSCGVPVPQGQVVNSAEEAWEAAQDIGLPVALKPYDGNHGRGVSLDLNNQKDIEAAFVLAARKGDGSVIVEQYIAGNEHRLLVVGKRVVAAARGEAAWVTGDGHANIIELVDSQINSDPRRGTGEDDPLNALAPQDGAEIILELERQGLTAYSVPASGEKVLIQRNGNVAFDVTDQVHPSVAAAATLAARVVGLDVAGVDLVLEDVSRPLVEQRGAVIEVNASPGLLAHLKPASGQPRPIGQAIIEHLFGVDKKGRIPVVGVTGSQNTTRIARLIAWLLHINGNKVGLACRDGFYLGARQVQAFDSSHWDDAQHLLINRAVDAAVFENDARMILSEGLAYDKCSVGVVTDVSGFESLTEFHIDDLDKLYNVLRTQVDVILPHGTAVLNADDPRVVAMAPLCDGEVIFYGRDPQQDAIRTHQAEGGRVLFVQGAQIVLAHSMNEVAQISLAALKPAKSEKPDMVMAAVAAAWAAGVPPELIAAGLRAFESDPKKKS
ncbi:MAG: cyanophycin synthetase [Gammaproteobacteria bacterium]|uniref:cyanophycin synthetase n=1 Tax=Rhodoferax sp. TaxID=50421 RepID=UPI0017D591BE|nr:cyanophycin synthetase [Rhodoferax sp.]MBU3897373.1 cyanophycin synthetase [Gammaproteobacteria bacterium]MBA3058809.1 cyanophycin synthetase [Rhodoferax sp.]MBU3999252.1 cyanophycin synthetase [Gammaproteobacteria bacterium]MBU4018719.1 cyanophycin synthetase [Gammaproteobacteria bacterium]MBU4079674.1 cyanophycin synthetase [Gammaproteobacteria bacterium]